MNPFEHQERGAEEVLKIITKYGLAYMAWEERTGKSLTSLLVADDLSADNILIISKAKALADWDKLLRYSFDGPRFWLYSYTSLHKVLDIKYDMVILDEAHNFISGYPKVPVAVKKLKPFCRGAKILYLSATPYAQGYSLLYHQLYLADNSPWKQYKTFYQWFSDYGVPYTKMVRGLALNQYDRTKEDLILADIKPLFHTLTREEVGFTQEPIDKIHTVAPSNALKEVYNTFLKHQIVELSVGTLVAESTSKLRTSLHQLEGGTIKIEDKYFTLPNTEKIDYILEVFGDSKSNVIMYNFKQEKIKLSNYFKNTLLLQATAYAEGINLAEYDNLIIYSQDYSTARHTQRRARQCNKSRSKPIVVHYILMEKGVSSDVYKTVSVNKSNFVDSTFNRSNI